MTQEFKARFEITPRYLTRPSKRRPGLPLTTGVKFLVAHDTGNPGSTASGNVGYYQRTRQLETASAHLFVDDQAIIECIPALLETPEKAWHVRYDVPTDDRLFGYDANDAAIGVEYCYGGAIDPDLAYARYVWVLAALCNRFGLDPASSIVGHFFLDPQRRTDPVTGLAASRRTYEGLLRDVVLEHATCTGKPPPPPTFVAGAGTARAATRLSIREGQPSRMGRLLRVVSPGTPLPFVGWVTDGESINGNARWLKDAQGAYFWSGGVHL